MRHIIETVYLQDIVVSNLLGISYTPKEGSALNDYLEIPPTLLGGSPKITHYTLGIASKAVEAQIDEIEHSPLDITLFEQIPLLMIRKDGADATLSTEYTLAKDLTVDGIEYVAYYAKTLDNIANRTDMYNVIYKEESNIYDIETFKFTESMLGKPSIKLPESYVFLDSKPSVAISASVQVSLSLNDVENIKNCISIIYKDNINYITDKITEIGILASNGSNGYYQHTHYIKINKLLSAMTLDKNKVFDLDIGGLAPINI